MKLYLLEPDSAGADWAPFAGVRPIAELRVGVWKVRERWEAALNLEASGIVGAHIAGFTELDTPPCLAPTPIPGPAVLAASSFSPLGTPTTVTPATRQLVAEGRVVGWVVPEGATWTPGGAAPGDAADGTSSPIEGLPLKTTAGLIDSLEKLLQVDCLAFASAGHDPVPSGSVVLGDPGLVACDGALVEPGVVFDTRNGAVVLGEGVEARNGCRLEGPLYVGHGTRLLGGYIRGSVFGPHCNVRGEISASVFLGYSNKAHEGFVGHSVVGHWVNLGAGTTTSNLKNTYGEVSLSMGGKHIPTGRQFLGSLIGDHAKTAIGTMLSTGTVVGAGANLFGPGPVPKEVRPFAWGNDGKDLVTEEGFLQVAGRVMPRRGVNVTPEVRQSLQATYRRLVP